jgi:hypothetical protein
MIFALYLHYDIAFTPLPYTYPTGIFPYALRGAGVSLTHFSSHVGSKISQCVNVTAMANLSWKYYIVFVVLNAIMFVVVWVFFFEIKRT